MPTLRQEEIERYLASLLHKPVTVRAIQVLGAPHGHDDVKGFGYGVPLKVDCQDPGGGLHTFVLHTIAPGPFGHETMQDGARELG